MESEYLPILGLNATVPDEYIHPSFRADFRQMVAKCPAITYRMDMERSTPGAGILIPFAYNLMSRALTDNSLFTRLVQASEVTQRWFFNDFFILDDRQGRLIFTTSPVMKTKSVSEDFLEFIKSIGELQLVSLREQVFGLDEVVINSDRWLHIENLRNQIRQLQQINQALTQLPR